ncbi:uncharacterized protein LOC120330983 [Styela clava]
MKLQFFFAFLLLIIVIARDIFASATSCDQQNPCRLRGGNVLSQCQSYVSHRQFLRLTLNVDVITHRWDWLKLRQLSYKRNRCPPTWRLLPSDTASIKLVNNMTPNINKDSLTNVMKVRTHGLQLSDEDLILNAQDHGVEPGDAYTYSFKILPDHPSGTFWYETEVEAPVYNQFSSGLIGALIVEDNPDSTPFELTDVSCPINCQHDVIMLFSTNLVMKKYRGKPGTTQYLETSGWNKNVIEWSFQNIDAITVNGQIQPTLTMARGQIKRIRMINSDRELTLELKVFNVATGETCKTREIAFDGIYLDEPRSLLNGKSVMSPSSTLDWLIRCDVPGNYSMVGNLRNDQDSETDEKPYFLTLLEVVEFGIENSKFPTTLDKQKRPKNKELNNKLNDEEVLKKRSKFQEIVMKTKADKDGETKNDKEESSNKFGYLGIVVIVSILILAAAYKLQ